MAVTLRVKVKPNSRESRLIRTEEGNWEAMLKSPPVDGKANAELLSLVSKTLKIPKTLITLKSGASSKLKRVEIQGLDQLPP